MVLDWESFRVDSHMDVTEFEISKVDQQSCKKYLDIGKDAFQFALFMESFTY